MVYALLFLLFFAAGLLGFGGMESLLAFLENALVTQNHWLTAEEFADLVALCRIIPGDIGQNAAALGGYAATVQPYGFWPAVGGALVATIGIALPSFLWTEFYHRFYVRFKQNGMAEGVLTLMRPLVPGLMAAAVLLLCTPGTFGTPKETPWQFGITLFLFFATLIGSALFRINSLVMIALCGIAGWMLL